PVTPSDAARELLSRRAARASLAEFARQAWPLVQPGRPLIWSWHLDAICEHLQAVSDGRIRRLLINVPYRTGKSLFTGVFWPSWDWIHRPERQWLSVSYAQRLATRDALRTRRLIQSPWYQARWPHVRLSGDQGEKSRYECEAGGYRLSAGMTGGVMGDGADILLIDDPHDRQSAHSEIERQGALTTYDEALTTRLNDPKSSAIVLIMQRLHEQDLSGHVLGREAGQWTHLMLPMEYEPERKCRTQLGWSDPRSTPGELLCPERIGPDELAEMKISLGSYAAAGQLQQRPSPAGGGIIRKAWWRLWPKGKPIPPPLHVFASLDTAFSERDHEHAAYSARTTWMVFEDDSACGAHALLLLSAWWDRVGYPELRKAVKDHHRQAELDCTVIERKASGLSLIQDLRRIRRPSLNVRGFDPGRLDKTARAYVASPMFEAGRIYYPDREWARKVIEMVGSFPSGAPPSADITDTVTQAVIYTKRRMWAQPPDEIPEVPIQDEHSEEWIEDHEREKRQPAYG
ncbi:MAG: hypothetical protein C4521_07475, partial [Actinobacteria bacterium]